MKNYTMAICIATNRFPAFADRPEYWDRMYPIRFTTKFRDSDNEIKTWTRKSYHRIGWCIIQIIAGRQTSAREGI